MSYSSPRPRGLRSDLLGFLLERPTEQTRVDLSLPSRRDFYRHRILQRLGVNVADHEVISIHRIGIEAPADFVWTEFSRPDPDPDFWPSRLARICWHGEGADHGKILLLGLPFAPLFRLDLVRRQETPPPTDVDGTRYALYRCSGGYPVGTFSVHVRSRIVAEGEVEPTQMFFIVAFDFFGRKHWLGTRVIRPVWESIHNRVTTQVLNRFKARCREATATVTAARASA